MNPSLTTFEYVYHKVDIFDACEMVWFGNNWNILTKQTSTQCVHNEKTGFNK